MYELLTGAPAFLRPDDESAVAVVMRTVTDPVPDLRPRGVPGALAEVVERAMAKEPGARHASALALGEALQAVQQGAVQPVTPLRLPAAQSGSPRDALPALPVEVPVEALATMADAGVPAPQLTPTPPTRSSLDPAPSAASSPSSAVRASPLTAQPSSAPPSPSALASPSSTAPVAESPGRLASASTPRSYPAPLPPAGSPPAAAPPPARPGPVAPRAAGGLPVHEGVLPPVPVPGFDRPAPPRFGAGSRVWQTMVGLGMAAVVGVAAITVTRGGGFGTDAGDGAPAAEAPAAGGEAEEDPADAEAVGEPEPSEVGEPPPAAALPPPATAVPPGEPPPPPPPAPPPPVPAGSDATPVLVVEVGESVAVDGPVALLADPAGPLVSAAGAQAVMTLGSDDTGVALPSTPAALATAGGLLFVALPDAATVAAIDLATGEVAGTVDVGGPPRALAGTAGALWVGTDAGVVRVDPAALTAGAVAPTALPVTALAVSGDVVYAALDGGTALVRVGVASAVVERTVELAEPLLDLTAPAEDPTAVLVLGVRHVFRVESGAVTTQTPAEGGTAIAAGAGAVWVTSADRGELLAIDPGLTTVLAVTPLPGAPGAVAVPDEDTVAVALPDDDAVLLLDVAAQ